MRPFLRADLAVTKNVPVSHARSSPLRYGRVNHRRPIRCPFGPSAYAEGSRLASTLDLRRMTSACAEVFPQLALRCPRLAPKTRTSFS